MSDARAQCTFACSPPNNPPPSSAPSNTNSGSNNRLIWYIVGGVAVAALGAILATRKFPIFGPRNEPPPPPGFPPPPEPNVTQLPPNKPPGGQGGRAPQVQVGRRGFDLPPVGVTQFVPDEILVEVPANVSARVLDGIGTQLAMTRLQTVTLRLTGKTLQRWHINDGLPVPDKIVRARGIRQFLGAQPNYIFELTQSEEIENGDQYAPEKLALPQAHRLATGNAIPVAVIDSKIDVTHPDIAGSVKASFDAGTGDEKAHAHGTGMAGAIASHRTVQGVAPRVALLTVNAFSTKENTAEGTTFNIIRGLDWAASQGARVVNMSFAGPADPRLSEALAKASRKGMVLIAAAGNAGPRSPPLYPAADPNVIAVTATDIDDKLFAGANRGNHIAVAAPGVDVLVPAPEGTYQYTTGTSVASAEVSGVAALLLERNPSLTTKDVRDILMRTAKDLGPAGRDAQFGAGLVNALNAVTAAGTKRTAAGAR